MASPGFCMAIVGLVLRKYAAELHMLGVVAVRMPRSSLPTNWKMPDWIKPDAHICGLHEELVE